MRIAIHSIDASTMIELRSSIDGLGHVPLTAPTISAAAMLDAGLIFAEWAINSSSSDFFEGLRIASARNPPVPLVLLLSSRSRSFAERARAAGAADVLFLPADPLELQAEIEAVEREGRVAGDQTMACLHRLRETTLVGEDPRFRRCLQELVVAARSRANVLLLGETGVGKEMFAQAIHMLGGQAQRDYLAVNCASLSGHLLESELFGHARGAFTGADRLRIGRFEQAGDGTLLLDEVGDIEPPLQMKLLRVIEQREFQRVGENKSIPFRGRLICATSVDLERAVEQGRFRRDLLSRINQLRILIPPLRDRRGDIPLLATKLLRKHGGAGMSFSESVRQHLLSFDYPMNVRQLENIVISALAHAGDRTVILPRDLPGDVLRTQVSSEPEPLRFSIAGSLGYPEARAEALRAVDRHFLKCALDGNDGNQSAAAQALGIDRKTFAQRHQHALNGGSPDELP